ncbi:MAG: hypothetical protein K6U00_13860 [Armatimonadetes bacterium]|nr:hypothetical protein [Armatimonadota bacterium]
MGTPRFFRRLLIAGIIANIGVIALISLDRQEVSTAPQSDWKVYYSSQFGYNVRYPADWTKREIEVKDVENETRFARSRDTYFSVLYSLEAARIANLLRTKTSELNEPLIARCHNAVLEGLGNKFRGIIKSDTRSITVGEPEAGLEARETSFGFELRRGLAARKMRGIAITTWNNRKPISLLMVCPAGDFATVQPLFNDFASSFRPGKM